LEVFRMSTLRYLAASLLLGLIVVWASENMFWIVPPDDLTLLTLGLTWGMYTVASAAALSAVILTGVSGLWAAFLGGAVMGYLIEGTVVSTIYDAFPLQLIWTPLAWHALISGGLFVGLARVALRPVTAVAIWTAAAVVAVAWALYWPLEHAVLPSHTALAFYLVAPAALAVAAHAGLDRLLPLAPPPRWVLLVAPLALALLWLAQTIAAPSPLRLALFPCLALVIWLMHRRGLGAGWGSTRLPLWQRLLPLLPALAVTVAAPPLWTAYGAQPTNIPFALATGLASLALLVRAALRR
jgi:hypothetical protein